MLSQLMAKVLSGRSGYISGLAFLLLLVVFSSEVQGEDFKILLVRESGVDQSSGKPTGRLVVNGGYLSGIAEGVTGVIWRKNKIKGQIEVADLTITEVGPYEATGTYVLRHPDLFVQKKDRITLTVTVPSDADIVAKAVESLDDDNCFDAVLYFERIICPNKDNEFVLKKAEECQARAEKKLAGGIVTETGRARYLDIWEQLELVETLNEYKNNLAADIYLKRIFSQDSTLTKAKELRQLIPAQDLSALFSTGRCK